MRLINVDALIAEYDRVHVGEPGGARKLMENAPTVDAVPVVRCKDCKYMQEHYDTDGNAPYWVCKNWYNCTDFDGYCHEAERKKE